MTRKLPILQWLFPSLEALRRAWGAIGRTRPSHFLTAAVTPTGDKSPITLKTTKMGEYKAETCV